ncbi:hypothetical protein ACHQM5_014346 [Ranunculus cassubicifolius]
MASRSSKSKVWKPKSKAIEFVQEQGKTKHQEGAQTEEFNTFPQVSEPCFVVVDNKKVPPESFFQSDDDIEDFRRFLEKLGPCEEVEDRDITIPEWTEPPAEWYSLKFHLPDGAYEI